jgi:hypothetical protein
VDILLPEILKTFGPSSVFLWMLYVLWTKYTADLDKILGRYEAIVTENTKVQTLVVKALENLTEGKT